MDERERTRSRWLKRAEADLRRRDPVDALNDAEALLRFARARFERAIRRAHGSDPDGRD